MAARASSPIYHLVVESELRAGTRDGAYTPLRFAQDGFVHCAATRQSVLAVAHDYFAGQSEPIVLLEIDPSRLRSRVVVEAAAPIPGGGTSHLGTQPEFPHVYGPLELEAVAGAAYLAKRDGRFVWPERFGSLALLVGR